MAKKPETLFKERIKPRLEAIPKSWWVKTQMLSTVGIPDYIGCVNGLFVALELKASERDARRSQKGIQNYILIQINRAGGFATHMYPENADQVLNDVMERAYPLNQSES